MGKVKVTWIAPWYRGLVKYRKRVGQWDEPIKWENTLYYRHKVKRKTILGEFIKDKIQF